jgi:hypothetical protein
MRETPALFSKAPYLKIIVVLCSFISEISNIYIVAQSGKLVPLLQKVLVVFW